MAKKNSKYDDNFFNEAILVIKDKLFDFLYSWDEMKFNCGMNNKGTIGLHFNLLFLNSTIRHVTNSKTPYRPFTSSDLFELNDNIMFLESYLNYKAHYTGFKLTRNEFAMTILLIPID